MKKIADLLAAFLLFLLPVKFGSLAVMPESGGFFPEFFADWFFVANWHPHSLAYFSTLVLLLAVFCCRKEKLSGKGQIFLLFWSLCPALAVLPGIIRGDDMIALGQLSLLLGCAPLIGAVQLLLANRPERARFFITAMLLGGIVTAFYGWYQHLVTLPEMLEYAATQEAAGVQISEGMKYKLTDPRIFSTLASSNTLASLLMLMCLLTFWAGKYFSKYVNPPNHGKWAIWVLVGLLMISVLVLTRSRSAVVCPAVAGVLALFSYPKIKLRWKITGLAAGIILVAAGIAFAAYHGRGVASMGERADYWRTCALLCKEYPLTGAGWGGFFRIHMRIKVSDVDEAARDPHNVVAAFASQCGTPAGLLLLAVLLVPLVILWKYRFDGEITGTVFWCGVIFTLHSLIDCDWQVPALIATMGALYACAIAQLPAGEKKFLPPWCIGTGLLLLSLAGVWTSYRYLQGDYALSRLQDKVIPPNLDIQRRYALIPFDTFYSEACKYRPDSPIVEMYAGDWYMRTSQWDKAEKHYLRVLELEPDRPAAYSRLARIALLRGDQKKAEELQDKAHSLFPKSRFYTRKALYKDR